MGRGAAAGALLVALVVLGAPPAAGAEFSGMVQAMAQQECYFIHGTEKVRYVLRYIYNREPYATFDSDVGNYVGFTPFGERYAERWNSDLDTLEYRRASVDTYCRQNYEGMTPFITERRLPPSVSISLVPPSSSQPGPGRLLCSVMDFYPAAIQVRWFQGQQELSEHVVATCGEISREAAPQNRPRPGMPRPKWRQQVVPKPGNNPGSGNRLGEWTVAGAAGLSPAGRTLPEDWQEGRVSHWHSAKEEGSRQAWRRRKARAGAAKEEVLRRKIGEGGRLASQPAEEEVSRCDSAKEEVSRQDLVKEEVSRR
ncbi:HLA class II histocompatibility antigen, DR beta 4 chain-like [Molothrus aeneus]|uniref:HLA class II histocompatibility antigen, DR beta 4 chain-like n=1 Tax=Molothrus aeneus TaxID=84833 RepID=UPI00345A5358